MNQSNKTILRDEIRYLLEVISEQCETLGTHEEKIPQIEMDMILENIRRLYESLHTLSRISEPGYHPPVPKAEAAVASQPVSAPQEEDPALDPDKKPAVRPAVKIRVETTADGLHGKEPHHRVTASPEIDLFSAEPAGLTQKLQETREKGYESERISSQKKELKAAISINEKFLFINELFDGNLRDYNITIETLSGFSELRQALEFLDLMRVKNLWESESMAFRRLRELVEHQF